MPPRRALILCVVAKTGTPHQDTYFVGMTSKTIFDEGYECDVGGVDRKFFNSGGTVGRQDDSIEAVPDTRKRRTSSVDMMGIMEKHFESIGKRVSPLTSPATSASSN